MGLPEVVRRGQGHAAFLQVRLVVGQSSDCSADCSSATTKTTMSTEAKTQKEKQMTRAETMGKKVERIGILKSVLGAPKQHRARRESRCSLNLD